MSRLAGPAGCLDPVARPADGGQQPQQLLAPLGDGLARLGRQLDEVAHAYRECLARFSVEHEQRRAAEVESGLAVAALENRGAEDALSPTAPPPTARMAFFLQPAAPPPRCADVTQPPQPQPQPQLHNVWTKAVQPEGDPADHCSASKVRTPSSLTGGTSDSNTSAALEVVSEAESDRISDFGVTERVIAHRLLPRLGHRSTKSLITGYDLHQAVSAMGLERYTVKEMNHLVCRLAVVINLQFQAADKPKVTRQLSQLKEFHYLRRSKSEMMALAERAVWTWPEVTRDREGSWRTVHPLLMQGSPEPPADQYDRVVPLRALAKAMAMEDVLIRKLLGAQICEQLFAIKEVLVSGDANRLVSELTCVRIDDLATRTPEPEFSILEPLVGLMVIANSVCVGMQTAPGVAAWGGWTWVELGFTGLFLLEILVRQALYGIKTFFCGADLGWNVFDLFLICVGIAECLVDALAASNISAAAMVRFVRLLKLMRLVRIFRLRFMWELQLMIKGLLGGFRTLCWAFVLLVFVLYILGVLTFSAFGDDSDELIAELFADVPTSMFTAFRCVTGDCFTRAGTSATQALMHNYGLRFAICFFVAYIAITLGVFNVILAIYVETTMTAAKQTEDANKGSKERASIRVAHVTKRLLKYFCAAERSFSETSLSPGMRRPSLNMKMILTASALDSMEVDSTSISKELFLMVIQEPEVKKLMDELDLPPDRANLFDSIDADGSGSLEATELVRGLLKVRGEVKKSDQVACILALRAVQSTLREMGATLQESRRMLEHLGGGTCLPPERTRSL